MQATSRQGLASQNMSTAPKAFMGSSPVVAPAVLKSGRSRALGRRGVKCAR